jgi:hypothetical protein
MKHERTTAGTKRWTYTEQKSKGMGLMLLYEDLARARMRDTLEFAENERLVRKLAAANRWRWLARWAAKQANRAACGL